MVRKVFYSFHYKKDNWRVNQIRNMGVVEGNEPVSPNGWEEVKRKGDDSIKNWIDEQIQDSDCVVVLIGEETSKRDWIYYEIKKACELDKGLVGIYIHSLKDNTGNVSPKGKNPFDNLKLEDGTNLSDHICCYDPDQNDAYKDIKMNLESWVEEAIENTNTNNLGEKILRGALVVAGVRFGVLFLKKFFGNRNNN